MNDDWFTYWNERVGRWPTSHISWRYACLRVREEIAAMYPNDYGSDEMRADRERHVVADTEAMLNGENKLGKYR